MGLIQKIATLAIHKIDEPPLQVRKTLPPRLPHAEELALARRVIDPYAERVLKEGGEAEKVRTLEALARIEPERVLELIQQKKVFSIPFFNGMIGLQVAIGMMDESIDEALAVLEGLEDPAAKAIGYIEASKNLGDKNRPRAIEVLDRALLNARAAKEPDGIKLVLMGQVAELFLDLGQAERGRAILREGEALAKQLPRAGFVGYARGAFAEELVQIDVEAALALTKDLADAREFDRHHGNIAHELAGRDPAAVRACAGDGQGSIAARACTPCGSSIAWRRLTSPVPAAWRNRSATTASKGIALGMMALRLAEAGKDSARPAARKCIRIARATRRRSARRNQTASTRSARDRGRSAAGRRARRPRARR